MRHSGPSFQKSKGFSGPNYKMKLSENVSQKRSSSFSLSASKGRQLYYNCKTKLLQVEFFLTPKVGY